MARQLSRKLLQIHWPNIEFNPHREYDCQFTQNSYKQDSEIGTDFDAECR